MTLSAWDLRNDCCAQVPIHRQKLRQFSIISIRDNNDWMGRAVLGDGEDSRWDTRNTQIMPAIRKLNWIHKCMWQNTLGYRHYRQRGFEKRQRMSIREEKSSEDKHAQGSLQTSRAENVLSARENEHPQWQNWGLEQRWGIGNKQAEHVAAVADTDAHSQLITIAFHCSTQKPPRVLPNYLNLQTRQARLAPKISPCALSSTYLFVVGALLAQFSL